MGIFTLYCLFLILINGIIIWPASNSCSLINVITNTRENFQDKNWTFPRDNYERKYLELIKKYKTPKRTSYEKNYESKYNYSVNPGVEKNLKDSDILVDSLKMKDRVGSSIDKLKMNDCDSLSTLSVSEELNRHFKTHEGTNENITAYPTNRYSFTLGEQITRFGAYDLKTLKNSSTMRANTVVFNSGIWDLAPGIYNLTQQPSIYNLTSQSKLSATSTARVINDFISNSAPSTAPTTSIYKTFVTSFKSGSSQKSTKKERRNVSNFFDHSPFTTQNVFCTLCTLTTTSQKRKTLKCSDPCEECPTTVGRARSNCPSRLKGESPSSCPKVLRDDRWPHRRSAHADFFPLGKNEKTSKKKCKIKRQKAKYYNIECLFPTVSYANQIGKKFTLWCCQKGTECESPNIANKDFKKLASTVEMLPMKMEMFSISTTEMAAIKADAKSIETMEVNDLAKSFDNKKTEERNDEDKNKSEMNKSENGQSYNITALINPKTFAKSKNTEIARKKRNLKIISSLLENIDDTNTKEGNNISLSTPIFISNDDVNLNQTVGNSSKVSQIDFLPLDLIKKLISSPSKFSLESILSASKEHDKIKPRSILGQLLATTAVRPTKVKDRKPWEQPWKEGDLDLQLLNLSQARKPVEAVQTTELANFKVINEDLPVCPSCGKKVATLISKKALTYNDQLKAQKTNDLETVNEVNEDFAVIKLPSSTFASAFTKKLKSSPSLLNENIVTYTLSYPKAVENQADVWAPGKEYPMTRAIHIIERQGCRPTFYLEIPDQLGELIKDASLLKTKSLKKEIHRIYLDRNSKDGMKSNDSILVYGNPYDVENEKLLVPLPEFYNFICSRAKHLMSSPNQYQDTEDRREPAVKSQDNDVRQSIITKCLDHSVPLPPNPLPFALVPAYIPIKPPAHDLQQPYGSYFASSPRNVHNCFNIPRALDCLHSTGTTTGRPSTSGYSSNSTVLSVAKDTNKSLSALPKEIEASLINSILRMCTTKTSDTNSYKHNKVPLFIVMQDVPNEEPYLEFKKRPDETLNSDSLSIIPLQNFTNFGSSSGIQLLPENVKS